MPTSSSYQNQYEAVPTIHQFDEGIIQTKGIGSSIVHVATTTLSSFRSTSSSGDTSIRPNIGQTNSYEYALFGLALNELLDYQRTANLILCCITVIFLFITTLIKRFFHPIELLLSIYLQIFVTILAASDIVTMLGNKYDFTKFIRDQIFNYLGFLQYPFPGRVLYMILCGTLCIAIKGYIELLFGISFLLSATVTIYCWFTSAEYRKPYDEIEQSTARRFYFLGDTDSTTTTTASNTSWTYFNRSPSTNNTTTINDETESLITSLSSKASYQNSI